MNDFVGISGGISEEIAIVIAFADGDDGQAPVLHASLILKQMAVLGISTRVAPSAQATY